MEPKVTYSARNETFGPISTDYRTIDGLSVRFATGGKADGTPLLLTAPWPESLLAFHAIWPVLAEAGPVIAVDLPGFGLSEGRPDLMSPSAMGDFLIKLLDDFGLQKVHAVVPDVGTLAALFAASAHPHRFATIVAGSGGISMDLLGEPLRQIVNSTPEVFDSLDAGEMVVGLVRDQAKILPPEAVLEDYRLSSSNDRWNRAADFVRAYARDLPRLAELLPDIATPVLVLSGSDDPFVPPSNGTFLQERLQHCTARVLNAGHFVWEDEFAEYAAAAVEWIVRHGNDIRI